MENKLVSGEVPLHTPLFASTSLAKNNKNKKETKKEKDGDVGEGLGKQEIRDMGEVYSLDFFFCGNVFRIKLDVTFSRLPVEKYFLIPEGVLGKWNGLATRLWWKVRSPAGQCNTLHRICRVVGEGVRGPS